MQHTHKRIHKMTDTKPNTSKLTLTKKKMQKKKPKPKVIVICKNR